MPTASAGEPSGSSPRSRGTGPSAIVRFLALVSLLAVLLGIRLGTGLVRVPDQLVATLARASTGPSGFLLCIGLYLAGSLAALPGPLLLYSVTKALGLWAGIVVAYVATMISAFIVFTLGSALGREYMEARHPAAMGKVARVLHSRGVLRVLQLRLIPMIPFHLVNSGCGALGVPPWTFLAATMIGMVPKTAVDLYLIQALEGAVGDSVLVWSTQVGVGLALVAATVVLGARVVTGRGTPRAARAENLPRTRSGALTLSAPPPEQRSQD